MLFIENLFDLKIIIVRGSGSSYFMSPDFQFCNMKRILEMKRGDGCATMWVHSVPLNSFKNEDNAQSEYVRVSPLPFCISRSPGSDNYSPQMPPYQPQKLERLF